MVKKWAMLAYLTMITVTGATLTYLAFGPIMSGVAIVVMGTASVALLRNEWRGS